MRTNHPVSGREVAVGETANILSTTDLKGTITYANADFVAISGFSEAELLGQPHNIVRHPDMPEPAFADLWATLRSGKSWMGIVKNRCKNGDHYWVSAFATPVSRNGETIEYQSVRTRAQPEQIRNAEALYAKLHGGGLPAALRARRLGLRGGPASACCWLARRHSPWPFAWCWPAAWLRRWAWWPSGPWRSWPSGPARSATTRSAS